MNRLADNANDLFRIFKDLSQTGVVTERGIRYPVARVICGPLYTYTGRGLEVIDDPTFPASRLATDDDKDEFHDALEKDQISIQVTTRAGYESDYKMPIFLMELHQPRARW